MNFPSKLAPRQTDAEEKGRKNLWHQKETPNSHQNIRIRIPFLNFHPSEIPFSPSDHFPEGAARSGTEAFDDDRPRGSLFWSWWWWGWWWWWWWGWWWWWWWCWCWWWGWWGWWGWCWWWGWWGWCWWWGWWGWWGWWWWWCWWWCPEVFTCVGPSNWAAWFFPFLGRLLFSCPILFASVLCFFLSLFSGLVFCVCVFVSPLLCS